MAQKTHLKPTPPSWVAVGLGGASTSSLHPSHCCPGPWPARFPTPFRRHRSRAAAALQALLCKIEKLLFRKVEQDFGFQDDLEVSQ